MIRAAKALLISCLIVTLPAQAEEADDADLLALASLMLRDGHLDRAMVALDQVDLADEELDLVRYYTIRGLTHLRRGESELARNSLQSAVEAGEVDAVVHIYLAQVNYQLGDYQGTIDALERAGSAVDRVAAAYHMKAQSFWLLNQKSMAIAVLNQASEIFSEDASFLRRKVFFLIDLGLFKHAVAQGKRYLEQTAGKLADYIAIGNALRASGELDEAAEFLEQAQLVFPGSPEVKKVLAHVYLQREQMSAAADLLYQAALLDPELLVEAAELYRRSGQTFRALTLNSQLANQPEKLRQRLALYLEMGRYEQAAAMETPLVRVGLINDEDLRYAIAYSHFKTGDFAAAEYHLEMLTRPDLFRKAAELRRAIQDCGTDSWKCL
jgi:tetratricopeptide (TPR) repeat protein